MHTDIKILQLGKFYPIRGGVEKVMWDLTRGLGGRGIHCDMLCAALPDEEPRVIELSPTSRCIIVPAIAKKAATMISPAMIRYLRLHASEYDIIHVHHPDPMACLALCLSGYKGRVFLHWHSDILSQKFLLRLYQPLQKWLLKRAERIIGTTPAYISRSPWLKDFSSKTCSLPIGIEDTMCTGAQAGQTRGVRIFSLGRLVEYKGYRYLVEAGKYLPEDCEIRIGGEGPLRGELESQIKSLGVRVKLLGRLTDDEVREEMNACDVFVLPSIMKTEAFGIVQLEAMSCRKPVVATEIPGSGTAWVNAHGESGLNVPPRDAEALADAIIRLTADREELKAYGIRARARYETLFTLDAMLDGYMEMI